MEFSLNSLVDMYPGLGLSGDGACVVDRVVLDSRSCRAGDLFVAIRGTTGDGHDYLDKAVAGGCSAVLVDGAYQGDPGVPMLRAQDSRAWPALLARALHGLPDRSLLTVGVTGTNGKTTTAWLLRHLLAAHLQCCGLLGTILYDDGRKVEAAPLTTPDGPRLYAALAAMQANGCRAVAMEISSHALDQKRVAGLSLDAAILTNLSRDHLDYHIDMRSYLAAKAKIVNLLYDNDTQASPGWVVINADDSGLAEIPTGNCPVMRFSTAGAAADLRVVACDFRTDGTTITYDFQGRIFELTSQLVGRYMLKT
jgi:UDP-N-acetylmuramoyl-L-alanyl-D-glutamate--2,6-diaminopimelate ligase